MLEKYAELFQEAFGIHPDSLRDDQKLALQVLGAEIGDVIKSESAILFCTLRVAEADLLKDRPVYVCTNIRKESLKQIVAHAYERLVVKDLGAKDEEGR